MVRQWRAGGNPIRGIGHDVGCDVQQCQFLAAVTYALVQLLHTQRKSNGSRSFSNEYYLLFTEKCHKNVYYRHYFFFPLLFVCFFSSFCCSPCFMLCTLKARIVPTNDQRVANDGLMKTRKYFYLIHLSHGLPNARWTTFIAGIQGTNRRFPQWDTLLWQTQMTGSAHTKTSEWVNETRRYKTVDIDADTGFIHISGESRGQFPDANDAG